MLNRPRCTSFLIGFVFSASLCLPQAFAQSLKGQAGAVTPFAGVTSTVATQARLAKAGRKVDPALSAIQAAFDAHRSAGHPAGAFDGLNPAVRVADGFVLIDTAATKDPQRLA